MFVSVIHRIGNPDEFFAIAAQVGEKLPSDLKLPQYVTNEDRSTTICLWEAPSVDRLREFLEPLLQHVSKNEYLPITAEYSAGLPAKAIA